MGVLVVLFAEVGGTWLHCNACAFQNGDIGDVVILLGDTNKKAIAGTVVPRRLSLDPVNIGQFLKIFPVNVLVCLDYLINLLPESSLYFRMARNQVDHHLGVVAGRVRACCEKSTEFVNEFSEIVVVGVFLGNLDFFGGVGVEAFLKNEGFDNILVIFAGALHFQLLETIPDHPVSQFPQQHNPVVDISVFLPQAKLGELDPKDDQGQLEPLLSDIGIELVNESGNGLVVDFLMSGSRAEEAFQHHVGEGAGEKLENIHMHHLSTVLQLLVLAVLLALSLNQRDALLTNSADLGDALHHEIEVKDSVHDGPLSLPFLALAEGDALAQRSLHVANQEGELEVHVDVVGVEHVLDQFRVEELECRQVEGVINDDIVLREHIFHMPLGVVVLLGANGQQLEGVGAHELEGVGQNFVAQGFQGLLVPLHALFGLQVQLEVGPDQQDNGQADDVLDHWTNGIE